MDAASLDVAEGSAMRWQWLDIQRLCSSEEFLTPTCVRLHELAPALPPPNLKNVYRRLHGYGAEDDDHLG